MEIKSNKEVNANSISANLPQEIADYAVELSKKAIQLQNQFLRFKPVPLDDFPNLIKSRRKELNISSEVAAELSGLSRSAFQKIESGKSSPKLDNVKSICNTLGLNICVM